MTLHRSRSQLVLIDLQDKLLPKIIQHEGVLAATGIMVRTARLLAVPMLPAEQYPKDEFKQISKLLRKD